MIRKPVNYNSRTSSPEKASIAPNSSTNSIHSSPLKQEQFIHQTHNSKDSFASPIKEERPELSKPVIHPQPIVQSTESIIQIDHNAVQLSSPAKKQLSASKSRVSIASVRSPKKSAISPINELNKFCEKNVEPEIPIVIAKSVNVDQVNVDTDKSVQNELAILESALIAKIKEIKEINDYAFKNMTDVADDILSKFAPPSTTQIPSVVKTEDIELKNIDSSVPIAPPPPPPLYIPIMKVVQLETKDSAIELKSIKECLNDQIIPIEKFEDTRVVEVTEVVIRVQPEVVQCSALLVAEVDSISNQSLVLEELEASEVKPLELGSTGNYLTKLPFLDLDIPQIQIQPSSTSFKSKKEVNEKPTSSTLDFDLPSFSQEMSSLFEFF